MSDPTAPTPITLRQAATWLVGRADTNGNRAIGAHDVKMSPVARALMAAADTNRTGVLSTKELIAYAARYAGPDRRFSPTEFSRLAAAVNAERPQVQRPGRERPNGPAAPAAPAPAAPGPAAPAPAAPKPPAGSLPLTGIPASTPLSAPNGDGYRLSTMPTGGQGGGQTDAKGTLYVAHGKEIRTFDAQNRLTARVPLPFPTHDAAPSPDGTYIYVTHKLESGAYKPERLVRAADGSYGLDPGFRLDPFPMYGKMQEAEGMRLATDGLGNLYVADGTWASNSLNTVVKFSPDGTFVTRFGEYADGNKGDKESWEQGRFYWALGGLTVSKDGSQVFTTEIGNNRVQRWDVQGDGSYRSGAMWGATQESDPNRTGSDEPGRFAAPYDIGLDGDGNVFVMNTTRNQIQKFTSDGTFLAAMAVGSGPDGASANANQRSHGIAITAGGDAISVETGRMMERVAGR